MRQSDYYASLTHAVNASGARYWARSQDVKIVERSAANGDVYVQVRLPIDDNQNAADGRVQLIDTFVLSGDGRRVQSFDRRFHYNELGSTALWQRRLSSFRSAESPGAAFQQQFVDQVLTKPLVLARIKDSPGAMEFMGESGIAIQSGLMDDQMRIISKDPSSFVTVEKAGDGYKVKVAWSVDNDEDGSRGRFIMEDQFILGADKKFKSHSRQWRVHPDSDASGGAVSLAPFYGVGKPPKAKAQAFIEAILPALFAAPQPPAPQMAGLVAVPIPEPEIRGPRVDIGDLVVQGPEPRVETAPTVGRERDGGSSFEFNFRKIGMGKRNASEENINGLFNRAVGSYLKSRLEKRGRAGDIKFNFEISYDQASGHVTRVVATLLRDNGVGLSPLELADILKGVADRIHLNLRATAGLAGDTVRIPLSVIIQG